MLFLSISDFKLTTIIPEALTAIALLIAESDPMQKEIVIKLVVNLLDEGVKAK